MNKFNLDRTPKKQEVTDEDYKSLVGGGRDLCGDQLCERQDEIERLRAAGDLKGLSKLKRELKNELGNMCYDMGQGHFSNTKVGDIILRVAADVVFEGICERLDDEIPEVE